MKNIKFNYDKYIKDNYILRNRAVIKVLVNSNEEFYNDHDPRKRTINKSLMDYVSEEAENIPFKYNIDIEFYCDELTDLEKKNITNMIKEYYGLKVYSCKSSIRHGIIKTLMLFIFGAFFLACAMLNQNILNIIYDEVVYVIGWVLLWEATETFLFSNSKDKARKKNYKQLYNAKVLFSDKFELKD